MSKFNKRYLKTDERTDKHFWGHYKKADIQIDLEDDDPRFYILVWMEDGTMGYEGWAPESVETMDQAIEEAVDGAQL